MSEEEMFKILIDRDEFLDILYKNGNNYRVMKFDKALRQLIVLYNDITAREKKARFKKYISKDKIKLKIEELNDTKLLGGRMLEAFNLDVIDILKELLRDE